MNKRGNSSSSFDWKKMVGIVAGILIVVALIVSLVSCQNKKSNSDKPKERKVEEKDKKPKKKDKEDKVLDVVQEDVVVYSDFSNEVSTAKVTKMSNNVSKKEEKDETAPVIGDVTKAIVKKTNTIALIFEVTDDSDITEVTIGDAIVEMVDGQYKFVAIANGSYTINAKDSNGNVDTKTVEVNELITNDELESVYHEKQKNEKKTIIKIKKEDNIKIKTREYVSTGDNSGDVTVESFNHKTGKATVNGTEYDIESFPENKIEYEFNKKDSANNYVYYEVTKKTDAGKAVAANVKHVEFKQD